jgi:hypothetical protein
MRVMRSKLAEKSQMGLLEAARNMTPEQRLIAFLNHCQAMASLKAAGEQLRQQRRTHHDVAARTY